MKKKICKRVIAAAVAVCTVLGMGMPQYTVYASTTLDSLNSSKEKEKELEQRLESVNRNLKQLQAQKQDIQSYMNELDRQMEQLAQKIADIQAAIDAKTMEIMVAEAELRDAQQAEIDQYEAMKLRIQFMYEHGEEDYLSVLFSAESLPDLLNKAEYVNKITEYDRNMLDSYIAITEQIAQAKDQLEADKAEVQSLKVEAELELETVNAYLAEKEVQMEALMANEQSYKDQQAKIEEDKAALEETIAALEKQYEDEQRLLMANATATVEALYAKQLLLWPCPGVYRITSHFQYNRLDPVTGAYYADHKGTDIGASTGTPVIAAAAGIVSAAGNSISMGNYVVISHGDGITTRYYHNSKLAVSQGDVVTAGQTISYVGSTGWSTGPHLHFEVRVNGTPVDPMQFY